MLRIKNDIHIYFISICQVGTDALRMPYDEVLLLPPNSGNKRARANLGILAVTSRPPD